MEIYNLLKDEIDKSILKKTAEKAVKFLGGEGLEGISLVIVDDKKIREINKKYRGKDAVTDVLSFEELNEIYICLPQAKRQARLLKTSLNAELTRLLTHGIVHLKGYDHERSAKEARRMKKTENKILNITG